LLAELFGLRIDVRKFAAIACRSEGANGRRRYKILFTSVLQNVAQTLRASSPRSGASNESPPRKRLTSQFEISRSRKDFLISSRDGETRRSARAWYRSHFATARRSRQHQHQSSGGKGASASQSRSARVEARLETHGSRLDDIQNFVRAIENIRGRTRVFLSEDPRTCALGQRHGVT